MKKYQKSLLIGIFLGITLLGIWAYFFDFTRLWENIQNLNYSFLALSVLSYLLAYFVRSVRWNRLLAPLGRFSIKQTYLLSLCGNLVNYLIPIRAGEATKAILIKKTYNKPISLVLPSIFIDKFFDTIGIFIILIMIPFLDIEIVPFLQWLVIILLLIFMAGMFVLISAIVAQDKAIIFLKRIFFFIPNKYQEKLSDIIELFVAGTGLFKNHHKIFIEVIILTILGIVLDGLYFYLMFKSFGFSSINIALIFFGYTLLNLSYILPQPPGQIGSNEILMSLIFVSGMGMHYADAGSLMAVAHLITGSLVTVLGVVSLSMIGIRFFELIERRNYE